MTSSFSVLCSLALPAQTAGPNQPLVSLPPLVTFARPIRAETHWYFPTGERESPLPSSHSPPAVHPAAPPRSRPAVCGPPFPASLELMSATAPPQGLGTALRPVGPIPRPRQGHPACRQPLSPGWRAQPSLAPGATLLGVPVLPVTPLVALLLSLPAKHRVVPELHFRSLSLLGVSIPWATLA